MTNTEFAQAVEEHRAGLVSYARARGYATRGDAEDTVQDVLTAVWARGAYRTFRGDSNVFTWLCQCVRQRAIDLLRRRSVPERKEDHIGYLDVQDEGRAVGELADRARELVSTVADPIIQQALELWLDGCEWREIAIAVDATPQTIRRWVRETLSGLAREEEHVAGV